MEKLMQDAIAARRQAAKERCGVLVAAVLRPEEGEDRELEVVGRVSQQVADAVELGVGQAEPGVEWFRDRAQGASVSALSDGPLVR